MNTARYTAHHHTYASHHWWSRCEHSHCGLPRFLTRLVGGAR